MGKSNELGLAVLIRRNQPAALPQIQLPIFSHPRVDIAEPSFEIADDIPNGGVLCALLALLAFGLLRHSGSLFTLPKGFYPLGICLPAVSLSRPRPRPQHGTTPLPFPRRMGQTARHRPHPRSQNPAHQNRHPRRRHSAHRPLERRTRSRLRWPTTSKPPACSSSAATPAGKSTVKRVNRRKR